MSNGNDLPTTLLDRQSLHSLKEPSGRESPDEHVRSIGRFEGAGYHPTDQMYPSYLNQRQ